MATSWPCSRPSSGWEKCPSRCRPSCVAHRADRNHVDFRRIRMKTSIATVSLSGTLGEKLEAISAAQFDAVEIFENDLVTFNGTPADVARSCGELGLDIVTLQPFRDFEGMPAGQRERAFAPAERKLDTMQDLGTDLL